MDEVVKALLETNRMLTETIVDLSRELAGLRTQSVSLESVPFRSEPLFMSEEEEDSEYTADLGRVIPLLEAVGLDANLEIV